MRHTKTVSQESSDNTISAEGLPFSVNGTQTAPGDPFADLDSLRLSQDFSAAIGKRLITTVPVRKPGKQDFIRVHDSEDYRIETFILEDKENRETVLVSPNLWQDLSNEISPRVIFTCINRQKVVFLWPVRRPDSTGRLDSWSTSAVAAAQVAMSRGVRVSANMSLGGYDVFTAVGELTQPEWPPLTFKELLRLRGRMAPSGARPSTGPEKRSAPRAGQRLAGAVARRWRPPARSLRGRDRRYSARVSLVSVEVVVLGAGERATRAIPPRP